MPKPAKADQLQHGHAPHCSSLPCKLQDHSHLCWSAGPRRNPMERIFRLTLISSLYQTVPYGLTDRRCHREPHIFPDFSDRCDRTLARESGESYRFKDSSRERSNEIGAPTQHGAFFKHSSGQPSKQTMSPTKTSQVADIEPGQLLNELEQRQDDVLEQLDALDTQLQEVLRGLGVTLEDDLDEELV